MLDDIEDGAGVKDEVQKSLEDARKKEHDALLKVAELEGALK